MADKHPKVLDGHTIVDRNIVMGDIKEDQIQPNGLDLTVKHLWYVVGTAVLGHDSKMKYENVQKIPFHTSADGYYYIDTPSKEGQVLIDFNEYVQVPEGYMGIIYPRSSLLRVGAFITSAIWDTGFSGALGASLRTRNPLKIATDARLAQIVFYPAEFNGLRYNGRYQNTTSQSELISVR